MDFTPESTLLTASRSCDANMLDAKEDHSLHSTSIQRSQYTNNIRHGRSSHQLQVALTQITTLLMVAETAHILTAESVNEKI